MPWLTHTLPGAPGQAAEGLGCPGKELPPTCGHRGPALRGTWKAQHGLGTPGGSRAVCFSYCGWFCQLCTPQTGTEGVWEELGSPLPALVHLASGLHFYEWAGGELIPVTMHSGTLTTNLI